MNIDYERIERIAEDVLTQYGVQRWDALNTVELAEKAGFVVCELQLPDNADGMILVNMQADRILDYKTKKVILVNEKMSSASKRFVIAYELGHYFLDSNRTRTDYVLAQRDVDVECSADQNRAVSYFASCLLMPALVFRVAKGIAETMLLESQSGHAQLVPLLAAYFGVPERCVERRFSEVPE